MLDPAFRDTAPYHNRVLVHSATAGSLGLTASRSRFKYRVTATGLFGEVQTESPWINFDAARPMIDATRYGLLHTPFFDEGGGVQIDLDRDAATAAGFNQSNPPKALLLHQHNAAGQQVNVVRLGLGTDDTDGDGLPDAWELANFGDLGSSGSADADGDGVSNAAELSAGTNPLDTRLLAPDPATGRVRWSGLAGRTYTVERAPDLNHPFEVIFRRIPGVAGTTSVVDPALATGNQTWFYRVRTE